MLCLARMKILKLLSEPKMNQKQLKYPHSFEERRPTIHSRVLFIPEHYFAHKAFEMPPFESEALFQNNNPVCIEYCSGNGEWIIERAKANPHLNWFAVEKKFKRVRKIWVKLQQLQLNNLIVVCGDAKDFIEFYLKDASIEAIYINFPDPWPKDKHAKHRLLQGDFIKEMQRTLKEGKRVTIVTDDPDYSLQIINEMGDLFTSIYPAPFYIEKGEEYGTSYFNRFFSEKGKSIRMMQYASDI